MHPIHQSRSGLADDRSLPGVLGIYEAGESVVPWTLVGVAEWRENAGAHQPGTMSGGAHDPADARSSMARRAAASRSLVVAVQAVRASPVSGSSL